MYPSNAVRMLLLQGIWEDKYLNQASVQMIYEPASALDQTAVDTAATERGAMIADKWKVVADVDVKLQATTARYLDWTSSDVTELVSYSATAQAGTLGGLTDVSDPAGEIESLPPVMAFLVRKNTNKAGRPYRGRLFVPYISEEVVHDGIVDSGDEAAFRALAEEFGKSFNVNLEDETFVACNARHWARKEKDTSTENPDDFTEINKLIVVTSTSGARNLVTRRDRRYKHRNLTITP